VKYWIEINKQLLDVMDGLVKPPVQTLSSKIADFITLNEEIKNFHENKVAQADSNALALMSFNTQHSAFLKRCEALVFLKDIGSSIVWDHYKECLPLVDLQKVAALTGADDQAKLNAES